MAYSLKVTIVVVKVIWLKVVGGERAGCHLMSLNRAYNRKVTIITITMVVVKVIWLKIAGVRGLDDCDTSLTWYQQMTLLFSNPMQCSIFPNFDLILFICTYSQYVSTSYSTHVHIYKFIDQILYITSQGKAKQSSPSYANSLHVFTYTA